MVAIRVFFFTCNVFLTLSNGEFYLQVKIILLSAKAFKFYKPKILSIFTELNVADNVLSILIIGLCSQTILNSDLNSGFENKHISD